MALRLNSHIYWKFFVIILLILPLFLFKYFMEKDVMKKINKLGEVTFLTRNNSHCYYIYQDKKMGFEYDLAKAFAGYLGVTLKIRVSEWENLIDEILEGKGDIIASSMTVTPSRQDVVDFSNEYLSVQQRIIIHKENTQINDIEDLKERTIHVRCGTSYQERLNKLNKEGFKIDIKAYDDVPTEELIRQVSKKEIQITVADSHIALLNRRYYPDIRIAFSIEEPQSLAWAVRKGEKALLGKINNFFETIKSDGTFAKIYEGYYAGVEIFDYLDLKKFHRRIETRLPKYEAIIKKAAKEYGFDWSLIAAMIYQESHFDENAISYTGARGIMQLTQPTAEEMGISNRLNPEESITAGVRYLKKLHQKYKKAEGRDRILINLASYNVGHGHIVDAQKLALEMGLDPYKWSSLEKTLPLLRFRKYYKNTENGYCRGTEPVHYVNRILTYYEILKRKSIEF